ncbi:hypothetical protein AGMMS49975_14230 [Clostridia bacterium]|nr:hypothetical protein AGMMS49975_14230 [Clostridia bacterium]
MLTEIEFRLFWLEEKQKELYSISGLYLEILESLDRAVLNRKLAIWDIPLQIRLNRGSLYIMALRYARDSIDDAAEYVKVLRQLLEDIQMLNNADKRKPPLLRLIGDYLNCDFEDSSEYKDFLSSLTNNIFN